MSKETEYLEDLLCCPENIMGYGRFKGNKRVVNETVTLNKWTMKRINAIKQALEHYDQIMSADKDKARKIVANYMSFLPIKHIDITDLIEVDTALLQAQATKQEIQEMVRKFKIYSQIICKDYDHTPRAEECVADEIYDWFCSKDTEL